MQLVLAPAQLIEILEAAFPELPRGLFQIEQLVPGRLQCRMSSRAQDLRPGGTIQGPALMGLADTAAFLALLAHIGPQLAAATASLHIDFLRRPAPGDLRADVEVLKIGRRLAVMEARIYSLKSEGSSDGSGAAGGEAPPCVARAAVTYSLPG